MYRSSQSYGGQILINAASTSEPLGPGAVGGHWKIDPNGYDIFVAGLGDTYSSLADAFLGDANRWAEIYWLQSDNWRNNTKRGSRDLVIGDELYMPQEAVDASGGGAGGRGAVPRSAAQFQDPGPQPEPIVPAGMGGSPSPSPSPSPAPHTTPSQPSTPAATNWKKYLTWGGIGLGVVAVVGVGIAVATSD